MFGFADVLVRLPSSDWLCYANPSHLNQKSSPVGLHSNILYNHVTWQYDFIFGLKICDNKFAFGP